MDLMLKIWKALKTLVFVKNNGILNLLSISNGRMDTSVITLKKSQVSFIVYIRHRTTNIILNREIIGFIIGSFFPHIEVTYLYCFVIQTFKL